MNQHIYLLLHYLFHNYENPPESKYLFFQLQIFVPSSVQTITLNSIS
jgi:hypothetical protein